MNIKRETPRSRGWRAKNTKLEAYVRKMKQRSRESAAFIERTLRQAPLRRMIDDDGVERVRVELVPELEDELRRLCAHTAYVDARELDEDGLLATLALVALRGADELHLLMLDDVEEE